MPIKEQVKFDVLQPLRILSENIVPQDWITLIKCLDSVKLNKYIGIIITHGSDTIPYTSAAISYAYNHTPIPIVLVASNYPLEDERSNGLRNFTDAIDFIHNSPLPGVF